MVDERDLMNYISFSEKALKKKKKGRSPHDHFKLKFRSEPAQMGVSVFQYKMHSNRFQLTVN